jgi:hypothetical protein
MAERLRWILRERRRQFKREQAGIPSLENPLASHRGMTRDCA